MGSIVAVAIIGVLLWLNYGSILWNLPSWEGKLETCHSSSCFSTLKVLSR
jgi:hypothetical protein